MQGTLVVSPDWLAARRGDVRIVDVRDAWEYEGIGHVPGAVNVPFETFRAEAGDEGMLPGTDVWRDLMSEAGVAADDPLVAYDDTNGVFAARFLVTALLYGHRDLHLLDGDYSAWSRDHETEQETPAVAPTDYEVREPARSPLVDYETVLKASEAAVAGEDVVILDTREDWEYEEGHIPGAVQLDWREFVDEETRGLKSDAEIERLLEARGVDRDTRVVLYCNTARRISHTYVVLTHLGYDDVAFYEGSLTEWEARGGPIETA